MPPENLWRGTRVSNGIAISRDGGSVFWTDTSNRKIFKIPLSDNGPLFSRRVLFAEFPSRGTIRPDGLAVSASGVVWCAEWEGGSLVAIEESGASIRRMAVPACCPTSLCFVPPPKGPMMVVTTAGGMKGEKAYSGCVLALECDEPGLEIKASRLFF